MIIPVLNTEQGLLVRGKINALIAGYNGLGSTYVPLSGTAPGSKLSGSIEISNTLGDAFYSVDGPNKSFVRSIGIQTSLFATNGPDEAQVKVGSEGIIDLASKGSGNTIQATLDVVNNRIVIKGNGSFIGIEPDNDLSANYTKKSYVQKGYVDGLVAGLLDDRGSYDASTNLFPVSGGSGSAGVILKGDVWFITVAGTLAGQVVRVGDSIRALADSPGQTVTEWGVLETNIGYVPLNKDSNLSDLDDVSIAKINLGLDKVSNTPDNEKPASDETQQLLSDLSVYVDSSVAALDNTIPSKITTNMNGLRLTSNAKAFNGVYVHRIPTIPVQNTTLETSLLGTGTGFYGTKTLAAGRLTSGTVLNVYMAGALNSAAAATGKNIQLKIKLGANVVATFPAITLPDSFVGRYELNVSLMVESLTQIYPSGTFSFFNGATTTVIPFTTGATSYSGTVSNVMEVTATWSSASALNSISNENALINFQA